MAVRAVFEGHQVMKSDIADFPPSDSDEPLEI